MDMVFRPIGTIHSPYADPAGVPVQGVFAKDVRGTVEVLPEFKEALTDLEGFSHIVLLYYFHNARGYSLRCKPFLDTQERGVFATRAPRRPNPIGFSVVRLLCRRENILDIQGVDVIEGTPLIDIKPYIADFDARIEVKSGWYERAGNRSQTVADTRFVKTEEEKG